MSIKEDDPYRKWVYSLDKESLECYVYSTLPLYIVSKFPDISINGDSLIKFLDYKGWPLKYAEGTVSIHKSTNRDGSVSLTHTAAGNSQYKYSAIWQREIYHQGGFAYQNTMGEYADGPDHFVALLRLWLLMVECIKREGSQDWKNYFSPVDNWEEVEDAGGQPKKENPLDQS